MLFNLVTGLFNLVTVLFNLNSEVSVVEPEPPGAATFRVEPEPELIFCWPEPRARAAFFTAALALAASFWQAKKERLVVVTKHV